MPFKDPAAKKMYDSKRIRESPRYVPNSEHTPEALTVIRERRREYQRRFRATHAAYGRERSKAWRYANPDKVKYMDRRGQLRRRYGLTPAEFEALVMQQEGMCKICRKLLEPGRNTHVDHDHDTKVIRGVLCGQCNVLIGMAHNSPGILEQAITYLKETK